MMVFVHMTGLIMAVFSAQCTHGVVEVMHTHADRQTKIEANSLLRILHIRTDMINAVLEQCTYNVT